MNKYREPIKMTDIIIIAPQPSKKYSTIIIGLNSNNTAIIMDTTAIISDRSSVSLSLNRFIVVTFFLLHWFSDEQEVL